MNKSPRCFYRAVCCLLLTAGPLCRAAEAPNQVLDRFLNNLETYSAAFEQRLYDETGAELEKSVGVFYMRRPGMFHWAYWEPYAQLFISDGITLWNYDEDLEQVIIKNAADQIEATPAAILGGDINIADHYVVIELEPEADVRWLELTPRDVNAHYETVRLGFKQDHLAKMMLFDNLGQKNLITFLDTRRNATLNLELFSFTPPEGVDVIDNRR